MELQVFAERERGDIIVLTKLLAEVKEMDPGYQQGLDKFGFGYGDV